MIINKDVRSNLVIRAMATVEDLMLVNTEEIMIDSNIVFLLFLIRFTLLYLSENAWMNCKEKRNHEIRATQGSNYFILFEIYFT